MIDKSLKDKEVVFQESLENFYTVLESEQGGITDNWRVELGDNFAERDWGLYCEFEFEVKELH